MDSDQRIPRLLGAAFLFVFVTSLVSGLLLAPLTDAGDISSLLVTLSSQMVQARLSLLGWMITSAGVIGIAVLLFVVLRQQNHLLARVALGLWLAEAVMLPVALVGLAGLISLSREFVQAEAPANSYFQTLGEFLYAGAYNLGMTAHMWFYCLGGLIWYGLLLQSRSVPRLISVWGLLAVGLSLAGMALELLGYSAPMWMSLPLAPFEVALGLWLLLKGVPAGVSSPASQRVSMGFTKA